MGSRALGTSEAIPSRTTPEPRAPRAAKHGLATLALGALGVVYGDIGTSPLYALKECLRGPHGVEPTHANVLGVLSLIFWAITLVVTVKYLVFVMRADNRGEGGIFALLALVPEQNASPRGRMGFFVLLGMAGAALLYMHGVLAPAISVLSAVEGLEVATPAMKPVVVPLTCAILAGLFAIQRRGTATIGRISGPVMLLWFVTLGVLGGAQVAKHPAVLAALSPLHAAQYFADNGLRGGVILGAVVLAVTGGEALYADMGHFGARPVRVAWWVVVLPALVLAYFGQGALVLADPTAAANPFYAMVPAGYGTTALVVLACLATVIASQALIAGAFSLTRQAVQLGFLPRFTIEHTSDDAEGKVYVPFLNLALAVACVALVLGFGDSSGLASAYGIAVSGTMAITSIVFYEVARLRWKWPVARALPLLLLFLALDLPFLAANAVKINDGGWIPVAGGAGMLAVMLLWKRGSTVYAEQMGARAEPLADFCREIPSRLSGRVPGTAVFMTSDARTVPPALRQHAERIHVLHETLLVVSMEVQHAPTVPRAERLAIEDLGAGVYAVSARFGFTEEPRLPELVADIARAIGRPTPPEEVTYYLQRETFLGRKSGKMGTLTESIFEVLSRNAPRADRHYGVPHGQVIEMGAQVDL